jgi:hypothetical protein
LEKFGNTILSPLKNFPKMKLFIVLILVPLVLNAINFWLIDNILKFNPEDAHEATIVADVYNREEEKERRRSTKNIPNVQNNEMQVIVVENLDHTTKH